MVKPSDNIYIIKLYICEKALLNIPKLIYKYLTFFKSKNLQKFCKNLHPVYKNIFSFSFVWEK